MTAHAVLEPDEVDAARRHADHLVGAANRFDQLRRQLVLDAAEFADGPIWIIDGAPSAARWLAQRLGVLDATVREWIRVGRALRALHATGVAWAEGKLSFAKVRTLTRVATPAKEETLLEIARRHTANDLAGAIAAHLTETDPAEADRQQHRLRSITVRQEPDGMIIITARLPPIDAGSVLAAIDTRMMRHQPPREPDGTWPTVAQRRADALTAVLREPGTFEVLVHVTGDGNHLADGTPVNDHAINDHEPAYAQSRRTHTDELHRRCGPCHDRRHDEE